MKVCKCGKTWALVGSLSETFETENDRRLPPNPQEKDVEVMMPEDKHLIFENDNSKLVHCTVTRLSMLNKDIQKKILSRLTDENKLELKKEEVDEDREEEEATKDPSRYKQIQLKDLVQVEALHRERR